MRYLLLLNALVSVYSVTAQITEEFSDGDFSDGIPLTWISSQISGSNDFIIDAEELRNDGPSTSSKIFISTDLALDLANNDISWTFNARYTGGSPSNNNNIEIYLISDRSDLTDSPSGYYIRMGENGSGDGIDFYSTASGKLIEDQNDLVSSTLNVTIRISRTNDGVWALAADNAGGSSFTNIGSIQNLDFTSGNYFGFLVSHTSSNNDNFFFDNVIIDITPVADTTPPAILSVSAISDTEVVVQFSEEVDKAASELASNYLIDGGVSVTSASSEIDQSTILLSTSPLTNGQSYTLTINNVSDLSGNTILSNSLEHFNYILIEEALPGDVVINEFLADPEDNNDDFVELYNRSNKFIDLEGWILADESSQSPPLSSFILAPNSYLIIYDEDAARDYSSFGDAASIPSLTLNNNDDQVELLDSSFNRIAFVLYTSPPDEGISYELINPNDPCISESSYSASTVSVGFTPGTQNSVFDDTPDTTPPTISSFGYSTSLTINFSEVMDAESLVAGSYDIFNLTIDQIIVEDDFPTSVEVIFSETIELGQNYSLTLADLKDCTGNTIAETTISFGFGRRPTFNEIIITEILFDEDPSVGLTDVEYIEIFNNSKAVISTSNMSITDATKTVDLPSLNINSGEYVVLTTTGGVDDFNSGAVGVSGFPSLNNSGESLILMDSTNLIFSITYDPDWHDAAKSDGGYSLEMVDITNPCNESGANWKSSRDTSGGTPGRPNTYFDLGSVPDNMPPELESVTALSADTLRLIFDEKINPESIAQASYLLDPSISEIKSFIPFAESDEINIKLASDLDEQKVYSLKVRGITDCKGNELDETVLTFALPQQAQNNEIKLSEVLFNPRTNGVDFVEIYNDSETYISLKEWKLASAADGVIEDDKLISEDEMVLAPHEYLVFTTDVNLLLANYPSGQSDRFFELASLPSYPNLEGSVALLNGADSLQELFEYHEDFHYDLLESVDGVSLERVSFKAPINSSDNWRSASSTVGFATPGYANSQSFVSDVSSDQIRVDPEVFIPGNAGSGRDFTTINYQFDTPGKFANVDIYDQTGRLVKNLIRGVSLATSGFLRWDGDTNNGNKARMGYYVIIFEVYDSNGNSDTLKETVVVGRDF